MTSKAQSSTVKFYPTQLEERVCFIITANQPNIIAQRAFAFKNAQREVSIGKLQYSHNIRLQRENAHLNELLTQADKGQEILLEEVRSAQADLSRSQSMESQKEAENQKLREENESLKKTLGEVDNARIKLVESWLRAQKEIETLTVKNQEIAQLKQEIAQLKQEIEQLKKENEELRNSLEVYQDDVVTEMESELMKNFEEEENQVLEKNAPKQISQ